MKHQDLVALIGEPVESVIIAGRYGNATQHANGWWTCDPCYLLDKAGERESKINAAHAATYPWATRDYRLHAAEWMPFAVEGFTLYARSCSDGDGFFGNCVDAGWVVAMPSAMIGSQIRYQAQKCARELAMDKAGAF